MGQVTKYAGRFEESHIVRVCYGAIHLEERQPKSDKNKIKVRIEGYIQ
jgi:hypothetical protein